jgi:hypothetical protein
MKPSAAVIPDPCSRIERRLCALLDLPADWASAPGGVAAAAELEGYTAGVVDLLNLLLRCVKPEWRMPVAFRKLVWQRPDLHLALRSGCQRTVVLFFLRNVPRWLCAEFVTDIIAPGGRDAAHHLVECTSALLLTSSDFSSPDTQRLVLVYQLREVRLSAEWLRKHVPRMLKEVRAQALRTEDVDVVDVFLSTKGNGRDAPPCVWEDIVTHPSFTREAVTAFVRCVARWLRATHDLCLVAAGLLDELPGARFYETLLAATDAVAKHPALDGLDWRVEHGPSRCPVHCPCTLVEPCAYCRIQSDVRARARWELTPRRAFVVEMRRLRTSEPRSEAIVRSAVRMTSDPDAGLTDVEYVLRRLREVNVGDVLRFL